MSNRQEKASPLQENVIRPLLRWYEINARVLPWRKTDPNPYHVFLSEVMLQQTTVKTVTPYFERFIEKWPDFTALAHASLEDIYHAWAGLGYYSRAKNLHKSAQEIEKTGLPKTTKGLATLPGVGPYTSAAIAAILYDAPVLPLDGNILRMLARIHNVSEFAESKSPIFQDYAKAWGAFGNMNTLPQAMMDFANAICKPKNPACSQCPIQAHCQALFENSVTNLPAKRPKASKQKQMTHAFIIQDRDGHIGLERRAQGEILGDMWGIPTDCWADTEMPPHFPYHDDWIYLGEIRHIFTHIDLRIKIWHLAGVETRQSNKLSFFAKNSPEIIYLATLWKKILSVYLERPLINY